MSPSSSLRPSPVWSTSSVRQDGTVSSPACSSGCAAKASKKKKKKLPKELQRNSSKPFIRSCGADGFSLSLQMLFPESWQTDRPLSPTRLRPLSPLRSSICNFFFFFWFSPPHWLHFFSITNRMLANRDEEEPVFWRQDGEKWEVAKKAKRSLEQPCGIFSHPSSQT